LCIPFLLTEVFDDSDEGEEGRRRRRRRRQEEEDMMGSLSTEVHKYLAVSDG